jgi:hypothetical protein
MLAEPESQFTESDELLKRLTLAEARIADLESNISLQRDVLQHNAPGVSDGFVGYDDGFFIRPYDQERNPYELQVNGRMQLRHTGFVRDITQWTDNAGTVRPVNNRNDFEIERGRLEFRTTFLDPKLHSYLNLDFDTDDNHRVVAHDFWVNYTFCDAFDLYFGKAFVPGSRDWLNGALRTRLADRSMGTSFFRPDRTVGAWVIGEPVNDLFYRVMVGNSFNTPDLSPSEIDRNFVYSGSMWTHLGDYGQGYSDLEWHDALASQIGQSFTFANTDSTGAGSTPSEETSTIRLSDGTRLVQSGALSPGVAVNQFDIYLYAVDAALKFRGFSINGEYYFRWLQSIRGNGVLPISQMFDHGFYVEAGYFLVPKYFELNGRVSPIFGAFGDAQEYASGVNWFINGSHNLKFTFDVTKLSRNPVDNSGINYQSGDDGLLFRSQFQAAF